MLAALANEHGILVISDEIHAPLVAPGVSFTPYLEVPGAQGGVAIVSASKSFNLAGLKVALAVPGADCVIVKELHEVITHGANHLSVRSEEHTSELQSLMSISYAVFCLKKKTTHKP